MQRSNSFIDALLSDYKYALVTVYDRSDHDSVVCEGTVRSLSKILDFRSLRMKSFFVTEDEDGAVQAEIWI